MSKSPSNHSFLSFRESILSPYICHKTLIDYHGYEQSSMDV